MRTLSLFVLVVLVGAGACGGGSGGTAPAADDGGGGATGGPMRTGTMVGGTGESDGGAIVGVAPADARPAGADSGAVATAPVALSAFPFALAQTFCQKAFECCTPEELRAQMLSDAVACQATIGGLLTVFFLPAIQDSIMRQRVEYDGGLLATCLAKIRGAGCTEIRMPGFDPLEGMGCEFLKPKVMPGGQCRQTYECINGYCVGGDQNRDGVCAVRKANGAACMNDNECMTNTCLMGKCAAPMAGSFCQG